MIKFGFFTDTHFRFDTPEERTDNFLNSTLLKLEEIGQIFKDEKVNEVLFGGDLYDSDTVAKSVISSVQTVLKSWQLHITGVVGSHDYFGYQMKTLKSTALGITESAGLIDIIGGYGHPPFTMFQYLSEDPFTKVAVVGMPHTYTFTDSLDNMYSPLVLPENSPTYQIQIVHADLNDKPVPWRHILIDDALTESDLCLSGHYHPGWANPIIKQSAIPGNMVTYINPGSVSRMKNTGVVRVPRVCIITVDNDVATFKYITLTSAILNPFKAKKHAVEEEPMIDIDRFLQLVGDTEVTAIDIKENLPAVAKEFNFSEEALAEAINLVDRVNGSEQEEN